MLLKMALFAWVTEDEWTIDLHKREKRVREKRTHCTKQTERNGLCMRINRLVRFICIALWSAIVIEDRVDTRLCICARRARVQ